MVNGINQTPPTNLPSQNIGKTKPTQSTQKKEKTPKQLCNEKEGFVWNERTQTCQTTAEFNKSERERKAEISAKFTAKQRGGRIGGRAEGGLSLADRQELADARSRRAGLPIQLLEPLGGSFSQRRLQERGGVSGVGGVGGVGVGAEPEFLSIEEENRRIAKLKKQGAFDEGTPRETILTSDAFKFGEFGAVPESIPVFTPAMKGIRNAFILSDKKIFGVGKTPEHKFAIFNKEEFENLDDLTIRELALFEIRRDAFNEGISGNERFG
ncbi:hypothetical protein LCGC14_2775320, partial [marine sediment metagenome]